MRPVSFAKYRRIEKQVADATSRVAAVRRRALAICAEHAGERTWGSDRGLALGGYRLAKAEAARCRLLLAKSVPVKGATRWYVGSDATAYDAAVRA
jgi:hypothetical protein